VAGSHRQAEDRQVARPIFVRDAAIADVSGTREWYRLQSNNLDLDFLEALSAVIARIGDAPEQFPVIHRNTRRAFVRRFPYAVFFRVVTDGVVILAVLHQARSPDVWRRRR
jgi:plasmid stabilization system protein ParE